MQRIIIVIAAFSLASLEVLLVPWLHIYGAPLPLAIVYLSLIGLLAPSQLVIAGIAVGVSFDLLQVVVFGLWTAYYCLAVISWSMILTKITVKWWWHVIWACTVTALVPIYAQLQYPTISGGLVYWLGALLLPSSVVAVVIALPCWILVRRKARHL